MKSHELRGPTLIRVLRLQVLTPRRPEAGAINVTAALIGAVVTAAVGGLAVSSVANMIPVAQDSAAAQNASQVGTAQGLARVIDGTFTDLAGLEADGYLPPHREAAGPRRFATEAGSGGRCFVVVSRSATGRFFFFTTDAISAPERLVTGNDPGCLSASRIEAMTRELESAAQGR